MRKYMNQSYQGGFNLMEVIIAVAVFMIGLLALASLQGSLTRSMLDSKVRTEAATIANATIEELRGFTTLVSTVDVHDYSDIVDGTTTLAAINGVVYNVTVDVSDFYYDLASDTFSTTSNGNVYSDYKLVEVVVDWDAAQSLRTTEGTEISSVDIMPADVTRGVDGDGNAIQRTGVKVTAIIPALITSASARVADTKDAELPTPGITYTPGYNPDVVKLDIGGDKFKESLLPQPDVIRSDHIETQFDVITYSTANGNEFIRREEFTAVSCDCTMESGTAPGRRPVTWAADEYTGGHFVDKAYGSEASGAQQSDLCGQCCRDHHDGGDGGALDASSHYRNVYGPFKGSDEYTGTARQSNHKHYKSDLTLAGEGDDYEEVCRFVRVDGFHRLTHDFRREDQYIFPADYLQTDEQVTTYSTYVTNAVGGSTSYFTAAAATTNYPSNPPCIGLDDGSYDLTTSDCVYAPVPTTPPTAKVVMQGAPKAAIDPSIELPSWSQLRESNFEEQQLRSRGVYVDYISDDLFDFIACLQADGGGQGGLELDETCGYTGDIELDRVNGPTLLEIIPFFEVQMTFLNTWSETPSATVVQVSSEALADNNAHSRGLAQQVSQGNADIEAWGHRGNVGFTDTPAIDRKHANHLKTAYLTMCSGDASGAGTCESGSPPNLHPKVIGTFSDTVTPTPTISVDDTGSSAICTWSGAIWECELPEINSGLTIKVYGYGKANKTRWACMTPFVANVITFADITDADAHTIFDLSKLDPATEYNINIQETACPSS